MLKESRRVLNQSTGRMLLRSAPTWRYLPALFPDFRPRPGGRDTKQIYAKSTAARAPLRLVYATPAPHEL